VVITLLITGGLKQINPKEGKKGDENIEK